METPLCLEVVCARFENPGAHLDRFEQVDFDLVLCGLYGVDGLCVLVDLSQHCFHTDHAKGSTRVSHLAIGLWSPMVEGSAIPTFEGGDAHAVPDTRLFGVDPFAPDRPGEYIFTN